MQRHRFAICPQQHSALSRTSILVIDAECTWCGGTECDHQILGTPLGAVNSFPAPDPCTSENLKWMSCHCERVSARDQSQRLGRTCATCFSNPFFLVSKKAP